MKGIPQGMIQSKMVSTERILEWITPIAAGAAAIIGAVAAVEWLLGTLRIARISESFVPMAPATALCSMLLGAGFLARMERPGIVRRASLFSISAALLLSLLILIGHFMDFVFGMDVKIERLFIPIKESGMGFVIGSMSPLTAVLIVLLAFGMVTWRARRRTEASGPLYAQVFAGVVMVSASLLLIGYWYGVPILYHGAITPVAFPTAAALFFLSMAVLFDGRDASLSALAVSRSVQSRIVRIIAPLTVLIILVVGRLFLQNISHLIELHEVVHIFVIAVLAGAATVWATVLVSRNIQKEVERAAYARGESEECFLSAFEGAPIGMALVGLDEMFMQVNSALCKILGYSSDQLLGKTVSEITHPDDRTLEARHKFKLLDEGGHSYQMEKRYVHADGHTVWGQLSVSLIRDRRGKALYYLGQLEDITERKRVEEIIRESETKFRTVFESSVDAIGVSRNGAHVFVNPAYVALFGYASSEELTGKSILDLIAPEERGRIQEYAQRRQQGLDVPSSYETLGLRRDGSVYSMDVHVSTYKLGGEIYTLAILRDISDRKQAEEAQRHLSEIVEKSLNEIYIFDAETLMFKHVNQGALRNLQYSLDDIKKMTPLDLKPEFTEESFRAMIRPLLAGEKKTIVFETIHRRADGSRYPVEVHLQIVGYQNERVFLAVIYDITERRMAEEALRESEERLRAIFDNTNEGILLADPETKKFYYGNKRICHMLGYDPEEIKSLSVMDIHPEEDLSYVLGQFEKQAKGDISMADNMPVKRKDSAVFYAAISASPLTFAGKTYVAGFFTDITERKRAEEALERANTEWSAAMDASNDIIYLLDADRRLIRANKMFYQLTRSEPNAVGRHITDIVHPQGEPVPCPVCRAQEEKRDAVIIMEADHPDNPAGWPIEIVVKIVRDKMDNPVSIFMSLHDLSHERQMQQNQKKLEEQLRQAQKMEAIGQLAGGVAHDFNNILSAIIGYGHLTLMKMHEDDPLRHNIEQMLESSQRATALTQSLLAFSRKQPIKMEPLGVNAMIGKFEKFLLRLLREDIDLKTRYSAEELTIMADRGQIEQVIMNIVTNARDAMPEKGTVTIETKRVNSSEFEVESSEKMELNSALRTQYSETADFAEISVADTGSGMDEATRQRIFEPFFTTKEPGKGTGLGLATVYGIIKAHNGFVNVYSDPGRGTAFRIYLPIVRSAAGAAELVRQTPVPLTGGSETILLAEDDAALRKMTTIVLRHLGYTVIEAENGREAVDKFIENKDAIRLVILDGIMPVMNGKDVYREISALVPGVRCIFMSGYAEDVFTKDGVLQDAVDFISKPVTPSALLSKVREVIDRAAR